MENSFQDGQSGPSEIDVDVGPAGRGTIRRFTPGNGRHAWFKDLDFGPEMVVVPAGSFIMGSADAGVGGGRSSRTERPAHRVTIAKPFAIGRFTVTLDEWAAAVGRGGIPPLPDARVWGRRGRRPASPLSWADTQIYIAWLLKASGRGYRLPTEAEWEYSARAGTRTEFWWGDEFCPVFGNVRDFGRSTASHGTVPVDRYVPNPWGLYQVHGNVEEWCEDAYQSKHKGYRGAPTDGSAWQRTDQRHRVKRGGSIGTHAYRARSAKRIRNRADNKSGGFRVVRSLEM